MASRPMSSGLQLAPDVWEFLQCNQLMSLESRFMWASDISLLFDVRLDHSCLRNVPDVMKNRFMDAINKEIEKAHHLYADILDEGQYEDIKNVYEIDDDHDDHGCDAVYGNQDMIKFLQAQVQRQALANQRNNDVPPPRPARYENLQHIERSMALQHIEVPSDAPPQIFRTSKRPTTTTTLKPPPTTTTQTTTAPTPPPKTSKTTTTPTPTTKPATKKPATPRTTTTTKSKSNHLKDDGVKYVTLTCGDGGYGIVFTKREGNVIISGVKPNSAAAKARLKHGMQIVTLAGFAVAKMQNHEITSLIENTRPTMVVSILPTPRRHSSISTDQDFFRTLSLSATDSVFYNQLWLNQLKEGAITTIADRKYVTDLDALTTFRRSGLHDTRLIEILKSTLRASDTPNGCLSRRSFIVACKFIAMAQQDIAIHHNYLKLNVRRPRFHDKVQEQVSI